MRVTILQPNYIPWRGYFNFFKQSDVFVFYDDVQYTKNDWRNRNLLKTPDGSQWLTIPVNNKNRKTLIKDIQMPDSGWQDRHLDLIERNYKNAPYFREIRSILYDVFLEARTSLRDLNVRLIEEFNDFIGLRCSAVYSSEIGYSDLRATDRLVAICKHLGATEYLTGDAAKDYLEVEKFGDIRVLWHKYKERVYPQLWGDFQSRVSIIDLLMNCGTKSYDII